MYTSFCPWDDTLICVGEIGLQNRLKSSASFGLRLADNAEPARAREQPGRKSRILRSSLCMPRPAWIKNTLGLSLLFVIGAANGGVFCID